MSKLCENCQRQCHNQCKNLKWENYHLKTISQGSQICAQSGWNQPQMGDKSNTEVFKLDLGTFWVGSPAATPTSSTQTQPDQASCAPFSCSQHPSMRFFIMCLCRMRLRAMSRSQSMVWIIFGILVEYKINIGKSFSTYSQIKAHIISLHFNKHKSKRSDMTNLRVKVTEEVHQGCPVEEIC